MKRYIKLLSLVLAAMLVVALFAGCSSNKSKTSKEPANNGTLIMATNAYFPPYEYYEGDNMVGIDVEIAREIANKLNMTLQIEDMDFDDIIEAVKSGVADFGMAGITVTEGRSADVAFSDVYATGIQVVIVRENSGITSIDDLEGKLIGVQQGTVGDALATEGFDEPQIQRYSRPLYAVTALIEGDIDAMIIDHEPAKTFVDENDGLAILFTEYAVDDYAIAVAKDNTELLSKINTALAELTADGTLARIIEKYIPA